MLESLAGLSISAKRVQLITERVGAELCRERDQATEAFLSGTACRVEAAGTPELLVISADGGRVQTRQADKDKKWKEDKVGLVYEAVPAPETAGHEYKGPEARKRSVVATLESWDRLGDHLSERADWRGYGSAVEVVFLSDAAQGIRSVRERCCIDATFILDWAHAVGHLSQCAQAAFGPGPKAEHWLDQQKDRLWNGRVKVVISTLSRLSTKLGKPRKKASENDPCRILATNVNYFRTNSHGMDYPTYRRKGWPIGSGIVESTIKQIGKRLKGTEKHWSIKGAEETLQVVAHLLSQDGKWENFWNRYPLPNVA